MNPREDAIHIAAQCWCDVNTSHIETNPALAMAFAKRLETKMQENDSLKQQVEKLKSEARLHDTIVTQLQRGHAAQLKTKDEKIAKYQIDVDWYEEASRIAIDAVKEIKKAALKGDETSAELECFHLADDCLTKINTLLGREGS